MIKSSSSSFSAFLHQKGWRRVVYLSPTVTIFLGAAAAASLIFIPLQWRRQTIKSGSAFNGQLYFQVGQMKGTPKVGAPPRKFVKNQL